MQVRPISFEQNRIKTKNTFNYNPQQPQSHLLDKPAQSKMQPQKFNFGGWFKTIDMSEVSAIKTKDGNPRFNKSELKDIKNLIKNEKINVSVVKQFADTMLDVKSISEVYLFAKGTSDMQKECTIIKSKVNSYEQPFKDWSDSLKCDYHTKFERSKINNGVSVYKLEDCFAHKSGIFAEGGKLYAESTVTAGPYVPDADDDSSSESSTQSYPQDDRKWNPLDPSNPLSPWYN